MQVSRIVNATSVRHATSELLLIVAGILIALAISDWHDRNLAREKELALLGEVQTALTVDLAAIELNLQRWKDTENQIKALIEILKTRPSYEPSFDQLFGAAYGLRPANLNTAAYESLKAIGLQAISNPRLRLSIAKVFDQHYESLTVMNDVESQIMTGVMRPYYLQHFSNLVFLYSATPIDYETVVQDRYFRNIVEYRLATITGNQLGFYPRIIEDIRMTLEMLDKELVQTKHNDSDRL
jgi:hypothetical protein